MSIPKTWDAAGTMAERRQRGLQPPEPTPKADASETRTDETFVIDASYHECGLPEFAIGTETPVSVAQGRADGTVERFMAKRCPVCGKGPS